MKNIFLTLFFLAAMSVTAQQKLKVACIGDSITEGAGLDSLTYPQQLQNFLGEAFEVKNFGLGGRTLLKRGDFPYWQESKYREALSWKPDIVIIKLGTNDSKPQNWIYGEEFVENYKEFLKSFAAVSKHLFICTPIPVFKDEWGITEGVVGGEIVPMVRKVAEIQKVNLVDLYTAMEGKGEFVPDGVHPDADGVAVIAKAVFEAIAGRGLAGR